MQIPNQRLALDAALWVARRALDLAKAVLDSVAYKAAVIAIEIARSAITVTQEAIDQTAKELHQDLEDVKAEGARAIKLAQDDIEIRRTYGPEAVAYNAAVSALEFFRRNSANTLEELRADVDALWTSVEYCAFTAAKEAVESYYAILHSLEPKRAALTMEEVLETVLEDLIGDVLDAGDRVINVRKVTIDGDLREMVEGGIPLTAHVVASVVRREVDLMVQFPVGDAVAFLKNLWAEVWQFLKSLVALRV